MAGGRGLWFRLVDVMWWWWCRGAAVSLVLTTPPSCPIVLLRGLVDLGQLLCTGGGRHVPLLSGVRVHATGLCLLLSNSGA